MLAVAAGAGLGEDAGAKAGGRGLRPEEEMESALEFEDFALGLERRLRIGLVGNAVVMLHGGTP